jgi:hypothetical protein
MPRRRPNIATRPTARQVRQLGRLYRHTLMSGMSSRLVNDIRRLEERHPDMWPSAVEMAMRRWAEFLDQPEPHLRAVETGSTCGVFECCGNPWDAHQVLVSAVRELPHRSARELRRFLKDLY